MSPGAATFPSRTTTLQFLKYGLMGVSNTLVDLGTYLLLTRSSDFFGTYIFFVKALSFLVAVTWSFFGNKYWTFSQRGKSSRSQMWKYYVTAGVNGVVNVSTHYMVVRVAGLPDTVGIVVAAGTTMLFGFILTKWWVFRE